MNSGLRFIGGLTTLASLLAAILFVSWLSKSETIPYNVRELVDHIALPKTIALWLAVMLVGTTGWAVARSFFTDSAWRSISVSIGLVLTSGSLIFVILLFATPIESIDDLVGTPVWGYQPQAERWVRFVGLFIGPVLLQSIGIRLAFSISTAERFSFPAILLAFLGIIVSYLTVVPGACTNNITELLNGNGRNPKVVFLGVWMVLAGFLGALPCGCAMISRKPLANWLRLSVFAILLAFSIPVSWYFVQQGTSSHIEKYDSTFSALQFLLSTDRSHYADSRSLFYRFSVVHLLVVSHVTFCGMVYWTLVGPRNFGVDVASKREFTQ